MRSQLARDVVVRPGSVVLGIVLLVPGGCQIPPDVLALPRSVHDCFTHPNFIVNAPLADEILGTAVGLPSPSERHAFA